MPFLPRFGSAQPTENKRLLLLTTGNGSVLPHWRPQRGGAVLAHDASIVGSSSRILAPILERHAERTIVVDGLDMAARTDADGVIDDGGGHGSHQALWTGRVGGGIVYDGPGAVDGVLPDGPSIDQVIADRIGGDTAVHSLQMGLWRNNYVDVRKVASYTADGQPLQTENDSEILYERLFGGFEAGGDPDRGPLRRRQSLSVLRGELQRLRSELPRDDQDRLDRHLAGMDAFDARLDAAALTCEPGGMPTAMGIVQRAEAHKWLIRQAFACGRTRVAAYNMTPEGNWLREEEMTTLLPGWSGASGEVHNTSHSSRQSVTAVEDMTLLKEWEAEWVADLLDLMHETPDGDGTLLDNTIVVWCTCMSHGGQHIVRNAPAVIVHGAGGPWNTGRYLRSPRARAPISVADWSSNSREFKAALGNGFANNQLLVSLARAFGMDVDTFGDARFTGPLEGLLS